MNFLKTPGKLLVGDPYTILRVYNSEAKFRKAVYFNSLLPSNHVLILAFI